MFFSDVDKNGVVEVAQGGTTNELLQQEHYYPFGMGIRGEWKFVQPQVGGVNQYLYNGKELNDDYGLNWNDYGARWYDASIARWNAVDPLAEDYSTWSGYNYVLGNPIRFVDPDGMRVEDNYIFNENGDFVRVDKNNQPDQIVVENSNTKKVEGVYQFNDPETDTKAINNGAIDKLVFFSDTEIDQLMERSGVNDPKNHGVIAKFNYAKRQATGLMDYGVMALHQKDAFYIVKDLGKAYNIADMGNFLFGHGANRLGIPSNSTSIGAHINNFVSGRSQKTAKYDFGPGTYGEIGVLDSPSDQRAIFDGAMYNTSKSPGGILVGGIKAGNPKNSTLPKPPRLHFFGITILK